MSTETELQPAVRPSSVRRDSKRKGQHTITPVVQFERKLLIIIIIIIIKLLHKSIQYKILLLLLCSGPVLFTRSLGIHAIICNKKFFCLLSGAL